MRYPASWLDDLRARVPVSHVVARKVKLKRAGKEFVGLSPFNVERTPSFTVTDAKGFWHDFSSGENGDQFAFLMKAEGLTFPEAVAVVAEMAGVDVPKASEATAKAEARKAELIEVVEMASQWFQAQLYQLTPAATAARAYLAERRIPEAEWREFNLGYSPPERSALKAFLAQAGYDQAKMIEAGLLIAGDDIPVSYDRFRGRIMFPIADARGKTIAFSARRFVGEEGGKYVNSPETPAFTKGRCLFNLHRARQPAHDGADVIAVEGMTGCVASVRAGYPASVATMGTAVTDTQLVTLWRLGDVPVICLDGDRAGMDAARKVVEAAFPLLFPGRSLRFAFMPGGADPDDVVTKRGPDVYRAILKAAIPLRDMLWRCFAMGRPMMTPEDRAAAAGDMLDLVSKIPEATLREEYRRDVQDRVRTVQARPAVLRSNGSSNHSASPGSIRLSHGYSRPAMTMKDATVLAAIADDPESGDVEAVEAMGLSEMATTAAYSILGGTFEPGEIARLGGETLNEAFAITRRAGLDLAPARRSQLATSILRRR